MDQPRRRIGAPNGYIDLALARELVRRRMFIGVNPKLLEAAMANLAYASNPIPQNLPQKVFFDPGPLELISDALKSKALSLFVYTNDREKVFVLSEMDIDEILKRAGIINPSLETIVNRFREFYPRQLLEGLEVLGIEKASFKEFGLCLRDRALEEWLANTARQRSWPLDSKPRRGRGRPERVSAVKPLLRFFIECGQWQQGMPLKALFHLINSKLSGEEVDRETVKKAMEQLYAETGQLGFRYVPRKRSALKKSRRDGR